MVEKFKVGKWYDSKNLSQFQGPAKCLGVSNDGKCGDFGTAHNGEWYAPATCFDEVPAPKPVTADLYDMIRARVASIDALTKQIHDLMEYDKTIDIEEVIPSDVRESIRLIVHRGVK